MYYQEHELSELLLGGSLKMAEDLIEERLKKGKKGATYSFLEGIEEFIEDGNGDKEKTPVEKKTEKPIEEKNVEVKAIEPLPSEPKVPEVKKKTTRDSILEGIADDETQAVTDSQSIAKKTPATKKEKPKEKSESTAA